MRNLPQTVGSLRQDGASNESSSFEAICPGGGDWPLVPSSTLLDGKEGSRSELSSPNIPNSKYDHNTRFTSSKGDYICTYIVEHRVRLIFSLISLIFLGIFFLVIYRRFSFVVFIITLVVIVVPIFFALIYARRLKLKELEKQQQKELTRGSTIRQKMTITTTTPTTSSPSSSNVNIDQTSITRTVTPIFSTNASADSSLPGPSRKPLHSIRKETLSQRQPSHYHKIKIQLPPSMIENV